MDKILDFEFRRIRVLGEYFYQINFSGTRREFCRVPEALANLAIDKLQQMSEEGRFPAGLMTSSVDVNPEVMQRLYREFAGRMHVALCKGLIAKRERLSEARAQIDGVKKLEEYFKLALLLGVTDGD